MGRVKDLTGVRFGRLVAQKIVGQTKLGNRIWECVCDCGRVVSVRGGNLKNNTVSCGCFREGEISRKLKPCWEAYQSHKFSAKDRGIEFLLTYDEWYKIWLDSGHLSERGKRKGQYVMARYGDIGPYSVENVKIISFAENTREGCGGKPWSKARREAQEKKTCS